MKSLIPRQFYSFSPVIHPNFIAMALFLVSDIVERLQGTSELKAMGGLASARPAVALLFFIPALSLAGVPPFSGFGAKLALIKAGISAGHYGIGATALIVSALTLYSMTKIWAEVFWKSAPSAVVAAETRGGNRSSISAMAVPVAVLTGMTVILGLAAGPLLDLALAAANQLLNPVDYIRAVLDGGGS